MLLTRRRHRWRNTNGEIEIKLNDIICKLFGDSKFYLRLTLRKVFIVCTIIIYDLRKANQLFKQLLSINCSWHMWYVTVSVPLRNWSFFLACWKIIDKCCHIGRLDCHVNFLLCPCQKFKIFVSVYIPVKIKYFCEYQQFVS